MFEMGSANKILFTINMVVLVLGQNRLIFKKT